MLGKQDIQKLNQYQRKILKSIMHLPERTANAGVYVLAGQLPIEADIDKKYLTHLINFLRSEGVEKELAWRQLEVKNTKSRSWFLYVAKILTKHNLQSIYDLLEHTVPKLKWRKTVKSVVKEHWKSEIKKKGVQKSSMRFMNLEDPRVGQPHQIWECASIDTLQVKKAGVRANLLAETYKLQLTVSNFQGGGAVSSHCMMCYSEEENLQHFILECNSLSDTCERFIQSLFKILEEHEQSCFFKINR